MNRSRKNKRIDAFTIIELLFVIAIIGVMASVGVTLYEQQAKVTKINKTALEIQQIVQAANFFYAHPVHSNPPAWPDASNPNGGSSDCSASPPSDLCPYLPFDPNTPKWLNPWGSPYTWKKEPSNELLDITTLVPSEATAKQIAARLPNATGDASGVVTMRVVPPGGGQPGGSGSFGGAGITQNGACVTDWTCNDPNLSHPHIFLGLASFDVSAGKLSQYTIRLLTLDGGNKVGACTDTDGKKGFKITANLETTNKKGGTPLPLNVLYVIKCTDK